MVEKAKHNPQGKKRLADITVLLVSIAIVIILNFLSSYIFGRFDLTSEKRYTLSKNTITQLETLEDVVFVRVYLEGNLPTEFRELHDAMKETLDDFKAYAGSNLEYEFIDPSASIDEKERVAVYEDLTRQGLQYSNVRMREGDKVSEQIVFPGAIMSYRNNETPIQLLKSQMGASEQEMIAISIQQLEYELMSAIKKVSAERKQRIGIIEGQGELDKLQMADAERALTEFYEVERVTIDQDLNALLPYDAIIVARPDSAFSEQDKFIIDQFIMAGGKALWLIDPVFARMDSLRNTALTMGLVLEHNLEDMLFKYGVRLNNDLVMDLQALPIPIVTGYTGNKPKQEMFTWYYNPMLIGNENHPITKNIDRLKTEFVSTLEPIKLDSSTSTVLLTTSDQSRLVNAPTRISFNILREPPRYEMFNTGPHATAVLVEGKFESVFKNRLPKAITANKEINFLEKSVIPTKMIVASDGDIIKNQVTKDESFYALGFDKYTNKMYGNKAFILNAMNYLCDDSGLLNVRSKEFKIRLLDQTKIDEERYFWQVLNTVLPIIIIFLFGGFQFWWRKRKYAR
ncbi:MAG: gliding motility-associated ABC transporter substrate-binding protein GldG [Salibacteraceae bacterium]|nr:gliding motility-associated ABC transporter substrate-binding protein GldG [Salibacteraceae bacterium]